MAAEFDAEFDAMAALLQDDEAANEAASEAAEFDAMAALLQDDEADVPERRLGLLVRSAATAAYARQCRGVLLMTSKVEALTTQLDDYDDRFSGEEHV
jgi:hypothetical protein